MSNKSITAFVSYHRGDDSYGPGDDGHQKEKGPITRLRESLEAEVRALGLADFEIFQDVTHINWGQDWWSRVSESLGDCLLMIPIITPRMLQSEPCLREVQEFLQREETSGSTTLILPVYFIDVSAHVMRNLPEESRQVFKAMLSDRTFRDWRRYRLMPVSEPDYALAVSELAARLMDVIATATGSADVGPPKPDPPGGDDPEAVRDALLREIDHLSTDAPPEFAPADKIATLDRAKAAVEPAAAADPAEPTSLAQIEKPAQRAAAGGRRARAWLFSLPILALLSVAGGWYYCDTVEVCTGLCAFTGAPCGTAGQEQVPAAKPAAPEPPPVLRKRPDGLTVTRRTEAFGEPSREGPVLEVLGAGRYLPQIWEVEGSSWLAYETEDGAHAFFEGQGLN